MGTFDLTENSSSFTFLGYSGYSPIVDDGFPAADDDFIRGFRRLDRLADSTAHNAKAFTKFPPIHLTVGLPTDPNDAIAGGEVSDQDTEQGCLSGSVGPQNSPLFSQPNVPAYVP